MSDIKKLTEDELSSIKNVKQEYSDLLSTLGELSYQKMTIDLLIDEEKKKVKDIKEREAKILDELKEKYGNVSINIETGEFQ